MNTTTCTCADRNCTETHDIETAERATFKIWFTGEMAETVTFADTAAEAIAEIRNLTADAPQDLAGWRIRNRATKTTLPAPKFIQQAA
jgi:hypothetical protein